MHSLIDFFCAFSLFARWRHGSDPFHAFFLYTFAAFALQLPIGIALDAWIARHRGNRAADWMTVCGALLTVIGGFVSPVLLGIGNALFHTGGGVLTIQEDRTGKMNGAGLGVFVAPGAIGLFLGGQLSSLSIIPVTVLTAALLAELSVGLFRAAPFEEAAVKRNAVFDLNEWMVFDCCFLVVVLRSAVGFAETFSWKQGFARSLLAVLMIAAGKCAGGLSAAKYGRRKTIVVSLSASVIGFLLGEVMPMGLMALFAFNMTMPLTLYLLAEEFYDMPGFAFGSLTFALFLGYVIVRVYGLSVPCFGVISSLVSLVLLLAAENRHGK